jgi:FAD dependent oxidoreductase
MKRRDFIPTLGLGGYSLLVRAAEPPAQQPGPTHGGVYPNFDRIAPRQDLRRMAVNEHNMVFVDLDCDVLVAGGGMAGICSAVAAARHGAKVILVQDRSRLGGNASSEVKMHIVGASCHKGRPGWRESGLLEEFRLDDAVNNPQRCWELWDLLLYDKVVSEPNITVLLDSVVFAAAMKGEHIQHALVRCDKTEHLYRVKAKIFCDCTGDSRLALEAGAEMRWGREARGEFNESLAPEKADKETLGSSILFTSRPYHQRMPFTPPKWARKITKEQLRFRQVTSWEYGYWWIEWGGNRDIIQDNERIRFELLSIVMGVWDYIKNSGDFPDSANFALDWVGMMPGKRGSRRLIGDHTLTQGDLLENDFEDAVAFGGWPMDDHPPGGFDRPDLPPNTVLRPPEVYNIPLRSLYSRNVGNLMMAGRNISASHAAFTSTRVMGTCSVVGQAVGTAAAQCVQSGVSPRRIYEDKKHLFMLQQALLRDDATIKGRYNQDPEDHARTAHVTASAEEADAPARLVTNGYTRDIPEKQINHWATRMSADGAWIELSWDNPRHIGEIQITFDSGFQRELTLSAQETVNSDIIRAPQPETARDYTIWYRSPGRQELLQLTSVRNNHQRLNRYRFEPIEARSVRVHIHATNGDDFARIFEVRCYS